MNNFVFSQDPLLLSSYGKSTISDDFGGKQIQFSEIMQQFAQPSQTTKDYLGELDRLLREMRSEVSESLLENEDYAKLNNELQSIVQNELMNNIKWRINNNQDAVRNIEKQMEFISKEKSRIESEERKNLAEINDYMKNYSNMTFDDYKKLKDAEP